MPANLTPPRIEQFKQALNSDDYYERKVAMQNIEKTYFITNLDHDISLYCLRSQHNDVRKFIANRQDAVLSELELNRGASVQDLSVAELFLRRNDLNLSPERLSLSLLSTDPEKRITFTEFAKTNKILLSLEQINRGIHDQYWRVVVATIENTSTILSPEQVSIIINTNSCHVHGALLMKLDAHITKEQAHHLFYLYIDIEKEKEQSDAMHVFSPLPALIRRVEFLPTEKMEEQLNNSNNKSVRYEAKQKKNVWAHQREHMNLMQSAKPLEHHSSTSVFAL